MQPAWNGEVGLKKCKTRAGREQRGSGGEMGSSHGSHGEVLRGCLLRNIRAEWSAVPNRIGKIQIWTKERGIEGLCRAEIFPS